MTSGGAADDQDEVRRTQFCRARRGNVFIRDFGLGEVDCRSGGWIRPVIDHA
jgi:hypothetical protein